VRNLSFLFVVCFPAGLFAQFRFETKEIATDLTVGYAVSLVDVNGDGKTDIVVVDSQRVVWYENPSWNVRTILKGKTRPDNVCIAPIDIDADGKTEFVLGADWKPFNTKSGGTLHWLKRGPTLDDEWSMHPIGEEPTVHRVRVADIDGDGKPDVLLAPLMGRDATREANWTDGRPVRLLAYPVPKDPIKGPWVPKVLSEELHVMHNFQPVPRKDGSVEILTASFEGVSFVQPTVDGWKTVRKGAGNQANPKSNRGASEIKMGRLAAGMPVIATIEPWHGNEVVVYSESEPGELWTRTVIDDHLRWGHGVAFADLDGDGADELIIGVRDNPAKGDTFTEKNGVRIYKSDGKTWKRTMLDEGGVAVEDLAAADLDGDGRIDIVAVGRATRNARIYWNRK
jgi:FG-GAP-like repeat/FG-GAP repeat